MGSVKNHQVLLCYIQDRDTFNSSKDVIMFDRYIRLIYDMFIYKLRTLNLESNLIKSVYYDLFDLVELNLSSNQITRNKCL